MEVGRFETQTPAGVSGGLLWCGMRRSGRGDLAGSRLRPQIADADARGIVLDNGGDDAVVVVERSTKDNAALTGKALASEGRRGGGSSPQASRLVGPTRGGVFFSILAQITTAAGHFSARGQ